MEDQEFESLKMVYENAAEQHRYFISWRQFLLAGYFAIIGILFYSAYTIFGKSEFYQKFTFVIILCISVISKFFLFLERRNKKLYQECQNVSSKIEEKLFNGEVSNFGLFYNLVKSSKKKDNNDKDTWTHSQIIDWFYNIIFFLTIVLTLFLFLFITLGIHCGCY